LFILGAWVMVSVNNLLYSLQQLYEKPGAPIPPLKVLLNVGAFMQPLASLLQFFPTVRGCEGILISGLLGDNVLRTALGLFGVLRVVHFSERKLLDVLVGGLIMLVRIGFGILSLIRNFAVVRPSGCLSELDAFSNNGSVFRYLAFFFNGSSNHSPNLVYIKQ